eukprot:TRINITY_DN366_c0_g3_i1.p1 TRINITY_DN366_c0_g3~~TRINITY_DN366_c0_g3_i1.p1  ORF type:complete len:338 (-),score=119.35 TRINITY_DN366_c0_g3_i1:215-1204(-)
MEEGFDDNEHDENRDETGNQNLGPDEELIGENDDETIETGGREDGTQMDQPDGSQNGESDSEERIAEEQRKKEVSIRVRLANRRARKKASKNPIRKARPDADPRDDIMNEDNIIRNEDNTEAVLSDDDDDDLPKKSRRRKKKNDKEDDDEIVEKPRKKSKEQRTAERRAAREQDDLSNIATTPDGDIDLTRATMADIIRYGGWIGKPMAEGTDPNEHHMGDQEEITQLEREDEEEETVEQIRTEGDEEDAYAPQVTVTEDGRIIIDESSLYVDAGATNAEKRKTQNFDNINWDSGSKVNYESFRAVRYLFPSHHHPIHHRSSIHRITHA